jgi:hypothetical protein
MSSQPGTYVPGYRIAVASRLGQEFDQMSGKRTQVMKSTVAIASLPASTG